MSIDKSLKKASSLARARNVLTRPERLAALQEDERWSPAKGVFNLPKTKSRRLAPGQSGPKRPQDLTKGLAHRFEAEAPWPSSPVLMGRGFFLDGGSGLSDRSGSY